MTKDLLLVIAKKAIISKMRYETLGMKAEPEELADAISLKAEIKILFDEWMESEQEYRKAFNEYYNKQKGE